MRGCGSEVRIRNVRARDDLLAALRYNHDATLKNRDYTDRTAVAPANSSRPSTPQASTASRATLCGGGGRVDAATATGGAGGKGRHALLCLDATDLVCAVDTAFMSTSRQRKTPIEYMDSGGAPNVLWELKPRAESDTAYHHGADISMLSQFAGEAEVVFPPCTMLVVQPAGPLDGSSPSSLKRSVSSVEDGHRFLPISVQPSFV